MRKMIIFVICMVLINTVVTGCSERLRKKFIRQPKSESSLTPSVLVVKEYKTDLAKHDLYENHFNFWKLWQWELIRLLDQRSDFSTTENRKRLRMTAERAGFELNTMQRLLGDVTGKELSALIDALNELSIKLNNNDLGPNDKFRIVKTLKHEMRLVERNLSPAKISEYLKETKE